MANQDEKETVPPPRPQLCDFHGVSMLPYLCGNWDNVRTFQAKPDDILIATYPKAVSFGSWYDHVNGWWQKKQTYPKLLYLHYEDLAEDIDRELDHICSFLPLSLTEEERCQVKEGVGFDTMKNNSMTNYSTWDGMDFKISPFMRKGKVGDWKNHFTVYQNEEFDKVYKKKMMNSTLRFREEI